MADDLELELDYGEDEVQVDPLGPEEDALEGQQTGGDRDSAQFDRDEKEEEAERLSERNGYEQRSMHKSGSIEDAVGRDNGQRRQRHESRSDKSWGARSRQAGHRRGHLDRFHRDRSPDSRRRYKDDYRDHGGRYGCRDSYGAEDDQQDAGGEPPPPGPPHAHSSRKYPPPPPPPQYPHTDMVAMMMEQQQRFMQAMSEYGRGYSRGRGRQSRGRGGPRGRGRASFTYKRDREEEKNAEVGVADQETAEAPGKDSEEAKKQKLEAIRAKRADQLAKNRALAEVQKKKVAELIEAKKKRIEELEKLRTL
jgi:hypothetical protein